MKKKIFFNYKRKFDLLCLNTQTDWIVRPTMSTYLLIGDPHFRTNNVDEVRILIKEIKTFLETNQVSFIVIMGDVLHNHEQIHTFALNLALEFFELCTQFAHTYVLVGNHDMTSNTVFLTPDHWLNPFKKWPNLSIIDKPIYIGEPDDQVIAMPYVPNGRMIEALNLSCPEWPSARLILAHQQLNGAKMGSIIEDQCEEWLDEFPMCISGHIHDKQWVKANLFYVGSAMQHAYGESTDKTLTRVTFPNLTIEEIDIDIIKKDILYCRVDEIQEAIRKAEQKDPSIKLKLVIKDVADKIAAFKHTSCIKDLEKSKLFDRIHYKVEVTKQVEMEAIANASYEHLLLSSIARENDPYLMSFAMHILQGRDDLSNKNVVFSTLNEVDVE